MNEDITVDISDGILTMTINRPQARNAISLAVAQGIAAALDELDSRLDVSIGILTGAGGTFCAGMDLKGFLRGERPTIVGRGFGGLTMRPPVKPLIAAVEGYALAGGFELVLACDLLVAAENAQFGIPEAKRGLAATGGGLLRLPRQLPYRIAMELALTGDMIPATRIERYGLVNRLTKPGEALNEARQLAQSIAANGPLAVAASKRVVSESRDWSIETMWQKQSDAIGHIINSEDAREGATAFAEKRKPAWKGK